MDNDSSASNIVSKELNYNTLQLTHDVHQSSNLKSSKKVIKIKTSHKIFPLVIEEKQPYTNGYESVTQDKQNQSNIISNTKQASHVDFGTFSEEKITNKKIENFSDSEKNQKSSSHKKRSIILLQKIIFQREAYTKGLMVYLPPKNYLLMNILRKKSLLSTDVKLMIKGQEMIKTKKMTGCLITSEYEIISENQRQNTLGIAKSNFSGSIFNIYQNNDLDDKKLVCTISYEDSFSFKSGPRSVEMYILHPEQSVDDIILKRQAANLKELCERGTEKRITKLKNKEPEWCQNGYCVDFGVKHVLPSINNVILQKQPGNPIVCLYKIRPDEFELVIRQGVSPFIAYCFALSSLTFKLACQ